MNEIIKQLIIALSSFFNITLNIIKKEIETFNDYSIKQIFEEINILKSNNFKLIKEKQ